MPKLPRRHFYKTAQWVPSDRPNTDGINVGSIALNLTNYRLRTAKPGLWTAECRSDSNCTLATCNERKSFGECILTDIRGCMKSVHWILKPKDCACVNQTVKMKFYGASAAEVVAKRLQADETIKRGATTFNAVNTMFKSEDPLIGMNPKESGIVGNRRAFKRAWRKKGGDIQRSQICQKNCKNLSMSDQNLMIKTKILLTTRSDYELK